MSRTRELVVVDSVGLIVAVAVELAAAALFFPAGFACSVETFDSSDAKGVDGRHVALFKQKHVTGRWGVDSPTDEPRLI